MTAFPFNTRFRFELSAILKDRGDMVAMLGSLDEAIQQHERASRSGSRSRPLCPDRSRTGRRSRTACSASAMLTGRRVGGRIASRSSAVPPRSRRTCPARRSVISTWPAPGPCSPPAFPPRNRRSRPIERPGRSARPSSPDFEISRPSRTWGGSIPRWGPTETFNSWSSIRPFPPIPSPGIKLDVLAQVGSMRPTIRSPGRSASESCKIFRPNALSNGANENFC